MGTDELLGKPDRMLGSRNAPSRISQSDAPSSISQLRLQGFTADYSTKWEGHKNIKIPI